jgi:hypothetical protein
MCKVKLSKFEMVYSTAIHMFNILECMRLNIYRMLPACPQSQLVVACISVR